jgi:hypothetical protein
VAVTFAVPGATPVTTPVELTVATTVFVEVHATIRPTIGFPTESLGDAINVWVAPIPIDAVVGVMLSVRTGAGAITEREMFPFAAPTEASMTALP